MSKINRIIRGIRDRIPSGYLVGRTDDGEGQPHLVAIIDLIKTVHDAPGGSGSSADIQVLLDGISTTQGTLLYRNASDWVALAPGTSGFRLQTNGAGADPSWVSSALAAIADLRILANISGGSAVPVANTLTAILDATMSSTQGTILYRNASAWVTLAPGTAGMVLTTGGAGGNPAWTDAGVAGQILAFHPGYVTGRFYPPPMTNTAASLALSANILYAAPVYIGVAHTFTGIAFHVQSAAASGKKAEVGIYSNVNGQPNTKLFDTGNVLVDTTGDKTVSASMVLPIGWYWLVIASDGAPNVFSAGTGPYNYMLGQATMDGTVLVRLRAPWTFSAGALPSSFPAITYDAGTAMPMLALIA